MANYVELTENKLDWAMSFQRTGAFPLDRSSIFTSKADAIKYAAGNVNDPDSRGLCGTSYIGQIIAVSENENVNLYQIASDRSLKEVGLKTVGDDVSIEVSTGDENQNIITLKGLATASVGQSIRVKNYGTEVEPVMGIEFYTPDTTDMDTAKEDIQNLQAAVGKEASGSEEATGLIKDVRDLQTTVGTPAVGEEPATGLIKDIADLDEAKADKATTLAGYGITDAYTKEEINGKLTGALHYKGTYATFAELVAAVTDGSYVPEKGDTWNITTAGGTDESGVAIKAGDNVIYNGTGWDVSSGVVDLSAYYTSAKVDEELAKKVDKVTGKSLIDDTEIERLANMSDEANKTEASQTNGNIKIDGVETTVYTLPTSDATTLGGVKSSADQDKVKVETDGTMTVNNISASKVQGAVDKASGLEMADGTVVDADAILADSKDGVVKEAAKVSHTITIGTKTFDGSAAVEITSDDVPLPNDVVTNTDYATATVGGVVKSSTDKDKVAVEVDGTMSLNKVSADKVEGVVGEAAKVSNAVTVKNDQGQATKTFDGSAAVELTADDLGALVAADIDGMVKHEDIATADTTGVVKSSTEQDKVSVDATGVMTVNNISASKVQGTVGSAENVTAKINDKAITDIFEADGVTAKKATKLAAEVDLSVSGDATGSAKFDGSANADIAVTLKDSGVAAGTYTKVTVDAKGRVTTGDTLAATDIPELTLEKITDSGALAAKDKVARTDLDAELEADIAALETDIHTHANKTVLDGISSTKVTAWDDAAAKIDGKADKATTLAGYGITDAYTKEEVNGKLAGAFHYKGTYTTFAALVADVTAGTITPSVGDVYNITEAGGTDSKGVAIKAGDNVAFFSAIVEEAEVTGWDVLAGTTDLSAYYTAEKIDEELAKKANKDAFDTVSGKVDTLETKVGNAEVKEGDVVVTPATGLMKDAADLKAATAKNASDIADINTTIGVDAIGEQPATGLKKKIADNTAAIEILNGDAETAGSVANAVAASAKDLNDAITNITKDGGTIDTKIAAHNTAADAHQDLFNAKQNKIITKSITLDAADFAADATSTTQYAYKCNKTVEGISADKDYIPSVVPMKESEEVISEAVFSAEVDFEAAVLTFYSVNVPTASINLFVTFTEI